MNATMTAMARHVPLLLALIVALFLVAPLAIILPMSFSKAVSFEFPPGYWTGYYAQYFASHSWLEATANSFIIAFGSMVFTLIAALPAAFGFVRYRFRGKSVLNLLMMLPLIVPAVVSALGYGFLSPMRLVGGTHAGMIIAHSVLSIPVAFLVIAAALKGFDRNLERAAMSAGAVRCAPSSGDVAGAAARHPGRRPVRVPAPSTRRWWRSSSPAATHRPCRRRCSNRSASNPIPSSPWYRAAHRRGAARRARLPVLPAQRPQMQLDPLVNRVLSPSSEPRTRGSRTIRRRVARRHRIHRRDLSREPEIPDRAQSRLLPEPDRPAGSPDVVVFSIRKPLPSRCGWR